MARKKVKHRVRVVQGKGLAVRKSLKELGGLSVAVGLPADKIHNEANIPVSELGAIHEFGLPEHGIPERSFLRSTMLLKGREAKNLLAVAVNKVEAGSNPEDELEVIALWLQGTVQERIVDIKVPPKAESTLKSYATTNDADKTNPLIKKGEMRQAVIGVVVKR